MGVRRLVGERRRLFLNTLSATGNVSAAARAAGVGRSTVYENRQVDARFAADWEDAKESAFDEVAQKIRDRVLNGDPRPLVTGGKLVKDDDGQVVVVHEYDTKLLEIYLKTFAPERYRDKSETGGKTARGPLALPPVRIVIANDLGSAPARQAGLRAADGGD